MELWIAPGDLVVVQGNLRPNVTRDCLALAKSKAPRPFSTRRRPTRRKTMIGPWLISYWSTAARR